MQGTRRRKEHTLIVATALAAELGIILLFAVHGDIESLPARIGWEELAVVSALLFFIYVLYVELRVKRYARALETSEARYALAVRGARDGVWDWDYTRNEIYYSGRWKTMLGFDEAELGSSPGEWLERVHPEDIRRLQAAMASHVLGHVPSFEQEYRIRCKDGAYRWMMSRGLAVRNDAGVVTRIAGSQTDVSDRKSVEERLAHQALYDPLTNLPNRSLFMDRLRQALRRHRRSAAKTCAVLFVDLDRFKQVNDSLGHASGDELLASFARRLEASVRPGDTVARLGGDEFSVLLDDVGGIEDSVHVAERLEHAFVRPFTVKGQEIFVTVSIGIAPGGTYENPEHLLRDADTAMYRAKERGRARFEIFDENMHSRVVERLKLETDLRRALERQEFRVHYQPIAALPDRGITGFEALVRWEHPDRGLLPPAEFLPLAEETGLILSLDLWTLGEACRQARRWQDEFGPEPPVVVHVNFSGKQFAQPKLADEVGRILRETPLDPSRLVLEITESVLLEDSPAVRETLGRLKDLRVTLSLDDFGTGYSSLSYLHRFPIDSLKIDRSFVRELGTTSEQGQVVRTIASLARGLNLGLVAEGVETPEQLRYLQDLNCDRVQGFLISKPLPPDEARSLLARHRSVGMTK